MNDIIKPGYHSTRGRLPGTAIAQLTDDIISPTVDATCWGQRTGVIPNVKSKM